MLAVEETSRALLGASRPSNGRVNRLEADSMTWELAAYGPTLSALRAVARLHKISLEEAIRNALDDYIATAGTAFMESIGATIAAYHQSQEANP